MIYEWDRWVDWIKSIGWMDGWTNYDMILRLVSQLNILSEAFVNKINDSKCNLLENLLLWTDCIAYATLFTSSKSRWQNINFLLHLAVLIIQYGSEPNFSTSSKLY